MATVERKVATPKPPLLVQAEIKPVASESGGWKQLRDPSRHSYAAIGSVSNGGGFQGVATYDRVTGGVLLKVEEIGLEGKIKGTFNIGQLTAEELSEYWLQSGGSTTNFGKLVEKRVASMISESTGQPMYNVGKSPSANGVDWRPQQLPLPFAQ
jgi:hypothetical protein